MATMDEGPPPLSLSPPLAVPCPPRKGKKKKKAALSTATIHDPSSSPRLRSSPAPSDEESVNHQPVLRGDTPGKTETFTERHSNKEALRGNSDSSHPEPDPSQASFAADGAVRMREADHAATAVQPITENAPRGHSEVNGGAATHDHVDESGQQPDETAIEAEADEAVADELPPLDPGLIRDLEQQTHLVAENLNHLLGNMSTNLHAMSGLTLRSIEAYRDSIDGVGVAVDDSIKSMYSLIAKCEGISQNMRPIYALAEQIKGIKKTLTIFEQMCK